MVSIIPVNLAARGVIFPANGVGMVLAQPFLSLVPAEPFQCDPKNNEQAIAGIRRVLEISVQAPHGAEKTHFTVFPECSIPGIAGVQVIDAALHDDNWATGTVVLGGLDGLSKAAFRALTEMPSTHWDDSNNGLDKIQEHEWVNCCVIWVKSANGDVEKWIQPKIWPAWIEMDVPNQALFRGNSVFSFHGQRIDHSLFRFSSLICSDWIGLVGDRKIWQWILNGLAAGGGETSLSWLFILQYNPKPSHLSFLNEIVSFFNQTIEPNVHRDKTCVVMANAAGRIDPGRAESFGGTAVLFSAQTLFPKVNSVPTYSNGGERFRKSLLLSPYRDAYFREQGACVHSFFQTNPGSLVAGAAGKTLAVVRPFVFPLDDRIDARLPSAIVPASIKWLNDNLDDAESLAQRYSAFPLAQLASSAHDVNEKQMRSIASIGAENAIRLAHTACREWIDEWEEKELLGLEHLLHTVAILRMASLLKDFVGSPVHGVLDVGGVATDLIAVRGCSHAECIEYVKAQVLGGHRPLIVVSRDEDNNPWNSRFGSFLTPTEKFREKRITDPSASTRQVGYVSLLSAFQAAATEDDVKGAVHAALLS